MEDFGRPSVLVPFPGPAKPPYRDVFVYLRPESNGVKVESLLLKAIEQERKNKTDINLVYLANLPGEFIQHHKIVEKHYHLRLYFAIMGASAVTAYMKRAFYNHFGTEFDNSKVLGAFEYLRFKKINPEDLFDIWVPEQNVLELMGQSVKKIDDVFVINYDIPALLHKNNNSTDIAVMVFRTSVSVKKFLSIISKMNRAVIDSGLLEEVKSLRRIFHVSRSPFEELLDAAGYLYNRDGKPVPLQETSYYTFLKNKGLSDDCIIALMKRPIVSMHDNVERSIFKLTEDMLYQEAFEILSELECQALVPKYI